MVDAPGGTCAVLLGNAAFAMGLVHGGFGAVEGYPGTPSSEVIDTLLKVPTHIDAGWSVNEAVAVGVALGRSLGGDDAAVTMKTPGLFQAADVVSSAAFYDVGPGAMVIYVATDYEPSSTQNIVDARYFLASCGIPVLEPRDHQDLYEIPRRAAALSRKLQGPTAVVCSGLLAHSEGIVTFRRRESRNKEKRGAPKKTVLVPPTARAHYDESVLRKLPSLAEHFSTSETSVIHGDTQWGVIAVGAAGTALKEAAAAIGVRPNILTVCGVYPFPEAAIHSFSKTCPKGVMILEEGGRFVEERIRLSGISVHGKERRQTVTFWDPGRVIDFAADLGFVKAVDAATTEMRSSPVPRPPSICPGCPYRSTALVIQKLKKRDRLETVFGDIGCSTLLMYLNALDLNLCMGASESVRQGYVRSRPEKAGRVLSLVGDSCECHSGMDASRNAVFRDIPGVKLVLDNRSTAMTGGQATPTTSGKLDLAEALRGEGIEVLTVDAFDLEGIETALVDALETAGGGRFKTVVVRGECLQSRSGSVKRPALMFDETKCTRCGRCAVCPGIALGDDKLPHFTMLCRNCGGSRNVCQQRCRHDAIVEKPPRVASSRSAAAPISQTLKSLPETRIEETALPESLRLAVRGIGGQGNLFLGRVLANVFLAVAGEDRSIIKGETHGMAQLGGPVISTFGFGKVYSAAFLPGTADVLISMETAEVLRPGFMEMLKPGGTLIFNRFSAVPPGLSHSEYPDTTEIIRELSRFNVVEIDAFASARAAGDATGVTANVAVIALLSTIPPFSALPSPVWLNALLSLSKNEAAAAQNRRTFETVLAKYQGASI